MNVCKCMMHNLGILLSTTSLRADSNYGGTGNMFSLSKKQKLIIRCLFFFQPSLLAHSISWAFQL